MTFEELKDLFKSYLHENNDDYCNRCAYCETTRCRRGAWFVNADGNIISDQSKFATNECIKGLYERYKANKAIEIEKSAMPDKEKQLKEMSLIIDENFNGSSEGVGDCPEWKGCKDCGGDVFVQCQSCKTAHALIEAGFGDIKQVAKEIFQILYELCKVRKQIEWDDIWFLVKRYGVEVDDE